MTTFLVMRHGQTEHTTNRIVAGITDSPLTTEGRINTLTAVHALCSKVDIDFCITSGMLRTKAIGDAFAAVERKPLFHDSRLHEKNGGIIEDALISDVDAFGLNKWAYNNRWHAALPGAETHEQVWVRVAHAFFEWAQMCPDATILVGSHTETIRIIRALKKIFKHKDLSLPLQASLNGVFEQRPVPSDVELNSKVEHFHVESFTADIIPELRYQVRASDIGNTYDYPRILFNGRKKASRNSKRSK